MPNEKTIAQAAHYADLDPKKAIEILDNCTATAPRSAKVLLKAKAAMIQAQAAINLNKFSDSLLSNLKEASVTFAANRRYDDWCLTMGLISTLAFSRGNIPLTVAASIQGFRETRGQSSSRLLASRGALWALSHQPGEIGDTFIQEVRKLIKTVDRSHGYIVAKTYLAWRDFKRVLLDAGIPSDSHPYLTASPSLTLNAAKRSTLQLIGSLEEDLSELQRLVKLEPVLLLFLAGMKGFVAGSKATIDIALQVLSECGAPAEASVHSVVGVAHCRNGEFESAKRHLVQAIEGHKRDGREHLAVTWYFYLAQVCSSLGQYQEAYDALNRFHAGRLQLIDPFVYQQMLEQAANELRLADMDIVDADVAPRHTQSIPPYLKKAMQWIEENLHQKVTAADIVRAGGVSRRTLELAFRAYSETSLMEELKTMRLRRARRLLRDKDASVASVMRQVGYTSAPAFSRDFRKAFGVAPRSV